MNLSDQKKEIEKRIVDTLITAFESGKVSEDEMSVISSYVLERIDAGQNEVELNTFLTELANRWEIFDPLVIIKQAEMRDKVEDEVAEGVLLLLHYGKLDNAIKLAKTVTHAENQNT